MKDEKKQEEMTADEMLEIIHFAIKEACIKYRDKFMNKTPKPKDCAWKYLCITVNENRFVCHEAYVDSEDEAIEWCERNVVADCHTFYRKVCVEC